MLRAEAGGNKTRLADMIGVTSKTVDRWLKGQVDVSEQSVREVARRLRRDQVRLLVTVGYYEDGELRESLPPPPPSADDDPDAEAIALIEAADIPRSLQLELIEDLRHEANQDAARRRQSVERALRLRTT
jgi:transcriptional regulator with XRE-family HTH domain